MGRDGDKVGAAVDQRPTSNVVHHGLICRTIGHDFRFLKGERAVTQCCDSFGHAGGVSPVALTHLVDVLDVTKLMQPHRVEGTIHRNGRRPRHQNTPTLVVWSVNGLHVLKRGWSDAVVKTAGGHHRSENECVAEVLLARFVHARQADPIDTAGLKGQGGLVAPGFGKIKHGRQSDDVGPFNGRGVQSRGRMVQRRAPFPSHVEVTVRGVAEGGRHRLPAVGRSRHLVAWARRTKRHGGRAESTVGVFHDNHGTVALSVDQRFTSSGEDVRLKSAVQSNGRVGLQVGGLQFCSGRGYGPSTRFQVEEVACEILVVHQGPGGTQGATTVVGSVAEFKQFNRRLRSAPVVDEAYFQGAVDGAEELCLNGEVAVEHPAGVHRSLQAVDEGIVRHLEGPVPQQQIGGGPDCSTLRGGTEHQRKGGRRQRTDRTVWKGQRWYASKVQQVDAATRMKVIGHVGEPCADAQIERRRSKACRAGHRSIAWWWTPRGQSVVKRAGPHGT